MPPKVVEAAEDLQPAAFVEQRRAGRMENPSPELIALMRRPSAEARLRVRLYDAPNFQPQPAVADRSARWRQRVQSVLATLLCGAMCAAAFEAMLVVWN